MRSFFAGGYSSGNISVKGNSKLLSKLCLTLSSEILFDKFAKKKVGLAHTFLAKMLCIKPLYYLSVETIILFLPLSKQTNTHTQVNLVDVHWGKLVLLFAHSFICPLVTYIFKIIQAWICNKTTKMCHILSCLLYRAYSFEWKYQAQMKSGRYSTCNDFWLQLTPRQISNISHTKFPNINVSRLVLQLYLPNPLKPGVKSRMKM